MSAIEGRRIADRTNLVVTFRRRDLSGGRHDEYTEREDVSQSFDGIPEAEVIVCAASPSYVLLERRAEGDLAAEVNDAVLRW
jgi:hypothetical protein